MTSGSLKLDICVAGDSIKHCLTPELAKLKPYPGIIIITVIINYLGIYALFPFVIFFEMGIVVLQLNKIWKAYYIIVIN